MAEQQDSRFGFYDCIAIAVVLAIAFAIGYLVAEMAVQTCRAVKEHQRRLP